MRVWKFENDITAEEFLEAIRRMLVHFYKYAYIKVSGKILDSNTKIGEMVDSEGLVLVEIVERNIQCVFNSTTIYSKCAACGT